MSTTTVALLLLYNKSTTNIFLLYFFLKLLVDVFSYLLIVLSHTHHYQTVEEFENRFSSRMYAYHRGRLYSSHYNHFLRLQCTQLDKKIFLGTVYSLVRYDFIAFGNLLSLSMLYFLVYTHGLQMDRRRSAP